MTLTRDSAPPRAEQPRPSSGRAPSRYFPAVDGLRGIAILSVLLYHTNWFTNGLFGVDAFFVLSGFLVTLLLVREAERTGRIAVGRFYRRRYKRLMPGLMTVLAVVVLFGYLLGSLQQARGISEQAIPALFQVANWAQLARGQAYWDHFGQIQPLGAMWSLSITEQFYLAWPLVLALLWFVGRRKAWPLTAGVLLLFAASSAAAPLMFDGHNTDQLYLSTQTRAVGFMAGAAAACCVHLAHRRAGDHPAGRRTSALLTAVGTACLVAIVGISVLVGSYHEPWLYQGGFAVVAALVALLAATLCQERGRLVRALSWRPLAETGQMSYSMYLLHLPVYWLIQQAEPQVSPLGLMIVGGGATWLLSLFLHYGLTERLRRREWRAWRAVPVSAAACLAITGTAHYLPAVVEYQMHGDGKPVVLTLGDSLANDFAGGLAEHGDTYGAVDGGLAGCGVMDPDRTTDRVGVVVDNWAQCRAWPQRWRGAIGDNEPDAIVVHLGWDAVRQRVDGRWMSPCDAEYRTRYTRQLNKAAALWRDAAPRTPVLLATERIETGANTAAWGRCYDHVVKSFTATAGPQVRRLPLDTFLCPEPGRCAQQTPDGERLYPEGDGVHFTDAGLDYVTPWLERQLSAALKT